MAQQNSSFPKYKVTNEIELDKVVCRFYAAGDCPDKECIFPHVDDEKRILDTACRYFLKGKCNFGKKCASDHVGVVDRYGVKVLKIIDCQFKERKFLVESLELQKSELSLSEESNTGQGASPLTESCLKTERNRDDELFYSELEKRQQNRFGTSGLTAKDLEIPKTEQNPFPRLRPPKKRIEITKTSRTALPPAADKEPRFMQRDDVFKTQNLGKCVPNDKIAKVESVTNSINKYGKTPIENKVPEETGDYKNLIPTQVFKNAIANDQRIGCDSWKNSQTATTHKFNQNLPCEDDFHISRPAKPENLTTGLNEEHKRYPQSSAAPVVCPQEKVSSRKGKKLVSQQLMENLAKQKAKIENTPRDVEASPDLFQTLCESFQNLPSGEDLKAANREGFQHIKSRCTDMLKRCFGQDDAITPSTSNIHLQGGKTFHEDYKFPAYSSSNLPPRLRSSEISQRARQISSNLVQPTEGGNWVQKVNLEGLQDLEENYGHKLNRGSNSETVQPSALNVPAQGGKIFHEDLNFPAQSSTRVSMYLRSSEISEASKTNSSIAKKKTDVKAEDKNVVTSQPTRPTSCRRSFKPSRKDRDN